MKQACSQTHKITGGKRMPKEEKNTYEKIMEQMDQNVERRVSLLALMGYLIDSKDKAVSNLADNCIGSVFALENPDGSLNKERFEKEFNNIETYKTEHLYKPAADFVLEDEGTHSGKWMYDKIGTETKMGVLQSGIQQAAVGRLMEFDTLIEEAYKDNPYKVLANLQQKKREELFSNDPSIQKEKIENIIPFFMTAASFEEGRSQEYLAEQKRMRKLETPADQIEQNEKTVTNMYKVFSEQDLSFLNDSEYKRMRDGMLSVARKNSKDKEWTPTDPVDKNMYEFSAAIDDLSKELKEVSGHRFSDSPQFNALKDRLAQIQQQFKKGSGLENREALFESVTALNKECQAYLDKNAGTRWSKRGNVRKDIVGRLQKLAQDQQQNLLAPETEEKMQREMQENLKQVASAQAGDLSGSQYAKDMEKLLVFNGESRENAKNQIQDAITDLTGNPAKVRKMEQVLTRCRHGLGKMDVRNEALKELGVAEPEKLDPKQMREILSAPENQNKLNDFYASVSDMAGRLSMEGTHPSLQAVLRGMEVGGRLETDREYERASAAMIKGLAGEKEWKQAREAYAAGDRSMDVTKMAALKTSLAIQRELILENGTLSGQNRAQTAAMEDLAKGTEAIIKSNREKCTDHSKAAEGLKLEDVMEGNAKMPAMERAAAAAVGFKSASVQSEIRKDLGEAQDMKEYEPTTHITQLDRPSTNNNLVAFYMRNQGYDQNTIFDDPEARAKAAKEFKKFVASHGSELDENNQPKTEKDRNNLKELGEYYKKSQEHLERMRIPDIDFSNPVQRAAHQFELSSLLEMMIDHDQNMTNPSKLGPVNDVFGGRDKFKQKSEELFTVQSLLEVGKSDHGSMANDFHGKIFGELYGDVIAGKTIGELRKEFANVQKDTVYMLGEFFYQAHRGEAEKFLSGEKKVTWDDAVKACADQGFPKETFQPLKDTLDHLRAEKAAKQQNMEQKVSEKQPEKEPEKKPEPKVEKMDLKSLMESEGKSYSSRRTSFNPEKDRQKSAGSIGK